LFSGFAQVVELTISCNFGPDSSAQVEASASGGSLGLRVKSSTHYHQLPQRFNENRLDVESLMIGKARGLETSAKQPLTDKLRGAGLRSCNRTAFAVRDLPDWLTQGVGMVFCHY
jgi:hypothetical protein